MPALMPVAMNVHTDGMRPPPITLIRFYPDRFLELAMDEPAGVHLLGMPFDVGGAGHTRYYRISREDFDACMADQAALDSLESNGVFLKGSASLYWSDYAPDLA